MFSNHQYDGFEQMASTSTLLGRCSREALESLLSHAIATGVCPSVETVKAKLPDAQHTHEIQRPHVAADARLIGTGNFEALPLDVLVHLIRLVPLEQRLACAQVVCKSWRSLRQCTELWAGLAFGHNDFDARYASKVALHPQAINGSVVLANVPRFMRFLPDCSAVTELHLQVDSNKVSLPTAKHLLTALPQLRVLSLGGKRASISLLTHLGKCDCVKSQRLTSLYLAEDVTAGYVDLIQKLPRLTAAVPKLQLGQVLREARGGAAPLLTHLSMLAWKSCTYARLASMGADLPELEQLRIQQMESPGSWPYANDPFFMVGAGGPYRSVGTSVVHAMPRLRSLSILGLNSFRSQWLCTNDMRSVMEQLLPACPALEELHLCHTVTPRPEDSGLGMDAVLPGMGGSLCHLPAGLKELSLGNVILEADAFALCALPQLAWLSLGKCGPHAPALADALKFATPQLRFRVTTCNHSNWTMETRGTKHSCNEKSPCKAVHSSGALIG